MASGFDHEWELEIEDNDATFVEYMMNGGPENEPSVEDSIQALYYEWLLRKCFEDPGFYSSDHSDSEYYDSDYGFEYSDSEFSYNSSGYSLATSEYSESPWNLGDLSDIVRSPLVDTLLELNNLRSTDEFTDCEIKIGNRTFRCHKAVVSASSPFFANILNSGTDVIVVDTIEESILEMIISYIYSGDIEFSESNCSRIFRAAEFLGMKHLLTECEEFLKGSICNGNFFDILKIAENLNLESLKDCLQQYFLSYSFCLSRSSSFLELSFELFCVILPEKYHPDHPGIHYEPVVRWILHDCRNRVLYTHKLFKKMHFNTSVFFLIQTFIGNENLSVPFDEKQMLVNEARKYLMNQCQCLQKKNLSVMLLYSNMSDLNVAAFDPSVMPDNWITLPAANLIDRRLNKKVSVSGVFHNCSLYVLINDHFFKYSLLEKTWKREKNLQQYKIQYGVSVQDDRLYIVGGKTLFRNRSQPVNDVEFYDLKHQEWHKAGKIMHKIFNVGLVSHRGLLYVFGGRIMSPQYAEKYDPSKRASQNIKGMPYPIIKPIVASLGEYIYVFASDCSNGIQKYNVENDTWATVSGTLPTSYSSSTIICSVYSCEETLLLTCITRNHDSRLWHITFYEFFPENEKFEFLCDLPPPQFAESAPKMFGDFAHIPVKILICESTDQYKKSLTGFV